MIRNVAMSGLELVGVIGYKIKKSCESTVTNTAIVSRSLCNAHYYVSSHLLETTNTSHLVLQQFVSRKLNRNVNAKSEPTKTNHSFKITFEYLHVFISEFFLNIKLPKFIIYRSFSARKIKRSIHYVALH